MIVSRLHVVTMLDTGNKRCVTHYLPSRCSQSRWENYKENQVISILYYSKKICAKGWKLETEWYVGDKCKAMTCSDMKFRLFGSYVKDGLEQVNHKQAQ